MTPWSGARFASPVLTSFCGSPLLFFAGLFSAGGLPFVFKIRFPWVLCKPLFCGRQFLLFRLFVVCITPTYFKKKANSQDNTNVHSRTNSHNVLEDFPLHLIYGVEL